MISEKNVFIIVIILKKQIFLCDESQSASFVQEKVPIKLNKSIKIFIHMLNSFLSGFMLNQKYYFYLNYDMRSLILVNK